MIAARNPRRYVPMALLSIVALALPQPATASGSGLLMSLCGGSSITLPIPGAPSIPNDKGCCKGCHSSSDRRKKKEMGPNDGCC